MATRGCAGCGKTTWAAQHAKAHPDKRYVTLGADAILEQMRARPALLALAQILCACGLGQVPAVCPLEVACLLRKSAEKQPQLLFSCGSCLRRLGHALLIGLHIYVTLFHLTCSSSALARVLECMSPCAEGSLT